MIYVGGKKKLWPALREFVLENHNDKDVTFYFEPFAGGMNCVTDVPSTKLRVASDIDPFLISLWSGLRDGRTLPETLCTRERYTWARSMSYGVTRRLMNINSLSPDEVFEIACWKYLASFSGVPFGGWVGTYTKRDFYGERRREILRHVKEATDLSSIVFWHGDYADVANGIFEHEGGRGIIYCDPPYATGRQDQERGIFDTERFWKWARKMREMGHHVYVSEYQAPADFTCIWEAPINLRMGIEKDVEKSFTIERLFI